MISKEQRIQYINAIKSTENQQRKALSLKQSEIYNDRLFQYVQEELRRHFSERTVREMPIVSFINFPRRIVNQEASVYKRPPTRSFFELSEGQKEVIEEIYRDGKINSKLKNANQKFKLQDQSHMYLLPVAGKLCGRVLYQHQIDAIPDPIDPEKAMAYIITAFDKEKYLTYQNAKTATGVMGHSQIGSALAGLGSDVAGKNDYKSKLEIYTYWDAFHNFVMNGDGDLIDPQTREVIPDTEENQESPIPGTIPIVDIALEKDFEYFVRPGLTITDFGTQYNAAISDTWHIARMQGFAIGVLKGPEEMMPESATVGPNMFMRLKTQPGIVEAGDIDFSFVTPSPDLAGTLSLIETMLVNFISSRGLDPKEIASTGSKTYASALERMLAMVDEFEASADDFKLFHSVEDQVYEVVKAWVNQAPDQLAPQYRAALPEHSYVSVQFSSPEMINTKEDELNYWVRRIEAGLATQSEALAAMDGIDIEEAKKKLQLIRLERFGVDQREDIPVRDEPGDRFN